MPTPRHSDQEVARVADEAGITSWGSHRNRGRKFEMAECDVEPGEPAPLALDSIML
jgi:hypothetical protein